MKETYANMTEERLDSITARYKVDITIKELEV